MNKKINQIKNSVLKKIKPSKQEEEKTLAFVDEIKRLTKTISGLDCLACGSIGKFTWLKNNHDIDMFILFPLSTSRQDLENFGLKYGKELSKELKGNFLIKYAEHPYVRIESKDFAIDVVPCYRIKKGQKIKSAVDRSPHHLKYVLDKLNPNLRDDVRLLKKFCKGIRIYGSDTKNMGFSGYICELLVIKYGNFENVLENSSKWKIPTIINTENFETSSQIFEKLKNFPISRKSEISKISVSSEILTSQNIKKKFKEPLIIIDPTDKNRNASANVSAQNLIKFIVKSDNFLKNPNENYFYNTKNKLSKNEIKHLKSRKTKFLLIKMQRPDIIDDILFAQMRRTIKRIENSLKHNNFLVQRSFEFANEKHMIFLFEFVVWDLPKIKKMIGPSIFSKKHSNEFLKKYSNDFVYIENEKWVSEKCRIFKDATELINSLTKRKDLKERGIPSSIEKFFSNSVLIENENLWNFFEKNDDFSCFVREKYFEKIVE